MSFFELKKLSRVARSVLKGSLPSRQAPSYANFCVHTEMLYDRKIYQPLLEFSRDFNSLTGRRITICVTTPLSPLVKRDMSRYHLPDDICLSRIRELKKNADIGYHGHFYKETGGSLTEISTANFEKDLVAEQIASEIGWLGKAGVEPKVYIAGWWFLNGEIVSELENFGIEVDVSVRKGKPDFFGGKYPKEDKIPPYGRPFVLPPSKGIVEIQSVFGPVMPPFFMKGHLSEYLDEGKNEKLFFVFPLHDWDISKYRRNIWANVLTLGKSKGVIDWMDIRKMREAFRSESQSG